MRPFLFTSGLETANFGMDRNRFTLEVVQDFMIENGGKVKNHELVTYFKSFLNDPQEKVYMRDKFKDYVNTLATIKTDENGDKILVLKKKYRPVSGSSKPSEPDRAGHGVRAQSEPPGDGGGDVWARRDMADGRMSPKMASEGDLAGPGQGNNRNSVSSSLSSSSVSSGPAEESMDASVVSVKERAKHLNRIESESEMQQISVSPLGKKKETKYSRGDDEESTGSEYVTLDTAEKEWLITCSFGDYHPIHQLLNKNPALAKVKDFTNTALHWAAKHGQPDIIKMLMGKPGVHVNQRTGYTPLHLAAIHGHEDVIELLVQAFKADPNVRDYSGKKAKQYLRNSASSRAQQLLVSTRIGSKTGQDKRSISAEEPFSRGGSGRRSNRARAISSLIQASSGGLKQTVLQTNWGSSEEVSNDRGLRTTPSSSPRNSAEPSPVTMRRAGVKSYTDRNLMPPPSSHTRRSKKPAHSISKESLMTDDKKLSEMRQVARSESEPNLGEAINVRSKSTDV